MRRTFALALTALASVSPFARGEEPRPIRVVVWDERQPEQKEAYDGGFLGDHIARELAKRPGIEVESVGLDDPEQGLTDERIDGVDVLIWWSHVRDGEFDVEKARRIAGRVEAGKLSLVVLHSGFAGAPFRESVNTVVQKRADQALINSIPPPRPKTFQTSITYLYAGQGYERTKDDPYDPDYRFELKSPAHFAATVRMPAFTIAGWREAGEPSHVRVLRPNHPIAAGLPEAFDLPQTEMYSEPFHVPDPDVVIFEERWDTGETFRSGCLWRVGKGYVFYFRPGHETYPVYKNPEPMKVLENAVRYLAAEKRLLESNR